MSLLSELINSLAQQPAPRNNGGGVGVCCRSSSIGRDIESPRVSLLTISTFTVTPSLVVNLMRFLCTYARYDQRRQCVEDLHR